MRLESSAFKEEENIPAQFTCDGASVHPPLLFIDVPPEAKTLALVLEDLDVPRTIREDRTWDHWVVWNIPPTIDKIEAGEVLPGVYGSNTSGEMDYEGPCPPDGEHRYFFRLYALDTELNLKEGATKQKLLNAMYGHILEEATLMGKYTRGKE